VLLENIVKAVLIPALPVRGASTVRVEGDGVISAKPASTPPMMGVPLAPHALKERYLEKAQKSAPHAQKANTLRQQGLPSVRSAIPGSTQLALVTLDALTALLVARSMLPEVVVAINALLVNTRTVTVQLDVMPVVQGSTPEGGIHRVHHVRQGTIQARQVVVVVMNVQPANIARLVL
jgi:hypothetical protein